MHMDMHTYMRTKANTRIGIRKCCNGLCSMTTSLRVYGLLFDGTIRREARANENKTVHL